jgi:Xaa-Pro aminopeptidase
MYADSFRSPEMRQEVPLGVPDPILFAEKDGQKHIVTNSMEAARLDALGLFQLHLMEELGIDELMKSGLAPAEVRREVALRGVRAIGVENAVVPETFPLWLADHLRANGIELRTDKDFFDDRRRAKTDTQIAGMRRAQRAAEAAMDKARELLRTRVQNGGLTVEEVKAAMNVVFAEHNTVCDDFIVAPGPQGAVGHDMGSGPIEAGVPVVIDIWPRDNESFIYCDFTRTYVVGDVPDDVRKWHGLCKEALDRAISEIRPGADGKAIFDGTCEIFEAAGEPTQRTKTPGEPLSDGFFHGLGHGVGLEVHEREPLSDGFFHGLGHGVGLEVHEQPGLGQISDKQLVPGDVVTVEPGLYRKGYGGVRLEDLVLVTDDGAENLTQYPYDLEP